MVNNKKVKSQDHFEFSKETMKKVKKILAKYPKEKSQSALIPLLDLAQRQSDGWLPRHVMDYVADFLNISSIRVYEVATFYTMFNLKPVGKNFVQVCRTTPCWLRGSDKIVETCKNKLGIGLGETTEDGEFTVVEVECLGACVNAPMVQINDDYYEDLNPENFSKILDDLKNEKKPSIGSQTKRQGSAPEGGPNTLLNKKKDKSSGEVHAS